MSQQPDRKTLHQRREKKKARRRMIIMILLAVIMVIVASLCAVYARWVKKPELPTPGPAGSLVIGSNSTPETDDPGTDLDAVQPKVEGERKSKDFYTILIVGTDTSSNHTDTIMVVSYDVTNQKATVMSIPRDTLVNSSAYIYTRVNSIYAVYGRGEKGRAALTREVSELIGFVPDYQMFINWELVGQVVDAIGGVEFDVPWYMEYNDPFQDLAILIQEGPQVLDGETAMDLVRWRKNNPGAPGGGDGSDLGRLKMQHDFLKAVLKQMLQLKNVSKIGELAELFGKNVESELTVENLFWFASQAVFGGLNVDDVEFITMPIYGYKAYVYPAQRELLEVINTKLNPFTTDVTMRELDLISVNADGSLRSSTGVLANPNAAYPQVSDTPTPSDEPPVSESPDVSTDPITSNEPDVSDEPDISDVPEVSDGPEPTAGEGEASSAQPSQSAEVPEGTE